MDFIKHLGLLALGSRLRRLSDRIMASGADIYRGDELDFEPRWFPLYRLVDERGPQTVGGAAQALGMTHAAVSQTVRAMAGRGILSAEKDARDERRRVLSLTARGRELLPKLQPLWDDIQAAVRDIASHCGADVLAVLDGMEHALQESDLAQRTADHGRRRQRDSVAIEPFSPDPEFRDAFRDLNVEWLEKYFRVEPVDHEVLDDPDRIIIEPGGEILFARVDAHLVGTCALQRTEPGVYELTKMAVTEAYQGRQIGKALMRAALDRARGLHAKRVFLVTNSGLTPAVTLYRRVGFKVVRAGPHPKYERGDLTMEMLM